MSSSDIRSILERLSVVEGKTTPVSVDQGLNAQQKSVPQLPALFKPKNASPALTAKKDPAHPMSGYMVGDSIEHKGKALAETMQEIEEDMLGKVKRDFIDYLERLQDANKTDKDLEDKAKKEIQDANPAKPGIQTHAEEIDEEPFDPMDSEVAHDIEQKDLSQLDAAEQPVKTVAMEDGVVLEIHGNEAHGFEVRHRGRSLPTRFSNLDHADMAVRLFQKRKKNNQDLSQDYIQER
jgi:hypothetical protein